MIDPLFEIFHKYSRLVRRNLVRPLACKHCKGPVFTALGENDELVLYCAMCDSSVTPGLDTISNVTAVVKEHFSE